MALDGDNIKFYNKIIIPMGLVLSPIGIILALLEMIYSTHKPPLSTSLFAITVLTGYFIAAIWYSRRHFGWFKSKNERDK